MYQNLSLYELPSLLKVIEEEEQRGRLKPSYFSKDVQTLSKELKEKRAEWNKKKRSSLKLEIDEKRAELDKLKKAELEKALLNINADKSLPHIKSGEIDEKEIFYTDDMPSMLICQTIKQELKHVYRLQPADRNEIVEQLKALLDNPMAKVVIRADVKSFFESIPQNGLLEKIQNDSLISAESLKFLKRIFYQFNNAKKEYDEIGLPRGLAFSSYLAELYLRNIDEKIQRIEGIFYYRRYVDDIIIVANSCLNTPFGYWQLVDALFKEARLILHNESEKKYLDIWTVYTLDAGFDYLGYHWHYKLGTLELTMTNKRYLKYELLINSIFKIYKQCSHYRSCKAISAGRWRSDALTQLFQRLRVLTGNGLLAGRKNYVATGIYYSNRYLTNINQLKALDLRLRKEIKVLKFSKKLFQYSDDIPREEYISMIKNKLYEISFEKNFKSRYIHKYPYYPHVLEDLKRIYQKHQSHEQV